MKQPPVYPDAQMFDHFNGLTILAYFAAHAPEVPDWFKLECPLPYPFHPRATLTPEEDSTVRDWIASEGETTLPESLHWYMDAEIKYNQEIDSYDRRTKQARYFAWRTFYATQMIQELNKAGV